jgi:outer membrane protein assembly factor BamA
MTWAAVIVAAMIVAPVASEGGPAASAPEALRRASPELAGVLGERRRERAALHSDVARASETITAIQIQGNTATSDEEMRRLADVRAGMPLEASTLEDVAARLRATKRFNRVEVLKRFASIADPTQIVLVIVVDEGAVRIEMTGDPNQPTRVVRRRRLNVMFLPVLDAEDGYGFTYGGRLALPNPIGRQSRLAFPLTWGGNKQAGAELEKTFTRGPVHRILAGGSIARRENPFFEENDDRRRVWVRGEREIVRALRVGATAGIQRVSFFDERDVFGHGGADVVLDTRHDPIFPRNAVYARAAWDRFGFGAQKTEVDARGYLGLFRQNVLAVRAQRIDANRPLPRYLQPLLGGMSNLRGFKAGTAAGDTLVAMSAELVVPLTSALHIGKIGVNVFADRGTVYNKGQRFADQTMREGYGAGVWFTAAFLRLNVAVAHGRGASTRVHAGGNVSF